ncbi:MAG: orotidine 5'-phosphate decarboxylase [Candidatus Freyarchaeota archaeon]|nr:orotidine 5'-phosphate decarboxylase [Candidatus Jordarchaeia archaeon]MBS7269624.1 orotidine 5'-phosphate decarboxylase [Candidatus Jordarchaeia archaeon]MBS7281323.1 orotidine 5'-phosphate decarboxylase [Candidatus Jordarchaeia archaeon]
MSLFREKLEKCARENESRVVLALDLSLPAGEKNFKRKLLKRARWVLSEVIENVVGVKVNFQLLLPLGLFDGLQSLIRDASGYGLPLIADFKLNDVEHTNEWASRHLFDAGFDALIANPFVGWRGGLETVFGVAKKSGKGVILLVYMSHPGANEGYGQRVVGEDGTISFQYEVFAERAKSWGADGVVVGATQPKVVERVYRIVGGKIPIFSPGIGVQGGSVSEAFKAGTAYAIVGRSIYESEDPRKAAAEIKEKINEIIK